VIRIYGIRENLRPITQKLSDVINSCMVEALKFPENKRAHKFIPVDHDDFFMPDGRSDAYTVIEINMMEGAP
jgi:hypothetical protein